MPAAFVETPRLHHFYILQSFSYVISLNLRDSVTYPTSAVTKRWPHPGPSACA